MNHYFTLNNSKGCKIFLPIDSVLKDKNNPYNLEKGSMIIYGDPPCPGMIKWIGYLLETNVLTAGVEMVSTHLRQSI